MSLRYVKLPSVLAFFALVLFPELLGASQSVHLTWDLSQSPDVVGYNIYYGTTEGAYTGIISVAADANSADVDGLEDGQTYYFAVTAFDLDGQESDYSNEASYSLPGVVRLQGAPVVLQTLPGNGVRLGWNPNPSPNVIAYVVYYGTQSGLYDNWIQVSADNKLDIYGLTEGSTYYFAVSTLFNDGTESEKTPETSYTIPRVAPPQVWPNIYQDPFTGSLTLSWPASPSTDVAGYIVYYGTQSGVYDSTVWVGNALSVTIDNLNPDQAYYFVVLSYDIAGYISDPSLESYSLVKGPVVVVPDTGCTLSLNQIPNHRFPNAFSVTATGNVPSSWILQSSSDMANWQTLTSGNDPAVNVSVIVSENPALFFRLDSGFEGIELKLDSSSHDRYSDSFTVSTSDVVPNDWSLQTSDDLQNWQTFTTGNSTRVNLAVVHQATPQLFFRLKSN